MIKLELKIKNIPVILWGKDSDKLFIAVHGNMSHKADDAMVVFAEEATACGYQVLSFDLPEHGERKEEDYACNVQNCVNDLETILEYAHSISSHMSLFACSMGAYFSLLTYKSEPLEQVMFLSPVVNMERIIQNMMTWTGVSEEQLEIEKEIATPFGPTLYWDYYSYVKQHPIDSWSMPTNILYGFKDDMCEYDEVTEFVNKFQCDLQVMEDGEHYFHTEEQLEFLRVWLKNIFRNVSKSLY